MISMLIGVRDKICLFLTFEKNCLLPDFYFFGHIFPDIPRAHKNEECTVNKSQR
jgi:hypothetical protein